MELLNVVRRLYHFGRSVSDLARACRLMGEGAYDRLHALYETYVNHQKIIAEGQAAIALESVRSEIDDDAIDETT